MTNRLFQLEFDRLLVVSDAASFERDRLPATGRSLLRMLEQTASPHLLLDLGRVPRLTNSGLEVLLRIADASRDRGGRLLVRGLRRDVRNALILLGLSNRLDFVDEPNRRSVCR